MTDIERSLRAVHTLPDGTITTTEVSPDPRFGMELPFVSKATVRTPAGRTLTLSSTRSVTGAQAADPFAFTTAATSTTINGKTYAATYDAVLRRITSRTPTGRTLTMDVDALGRATSLTVPGSGVLSLTYGVRGEIVAVDHGARTMTFTYDDALRVTTTRTRRFMTRDPIGLAGEDTNLYAYVLNDPINLVDPMGTDWLGALETVSNFSSGMGDTLSFGLTTRFNEWTGASAVVDQCSGAFSAGEWTGTAVSVAFGASHLGRNALKQGVQRLAYDNRTWGAVRSAWSGSPGTLRNTGRPGRKPEEKEVARSAEALSRFEVADCGEQW